MIKDILIKPGFGGLKPEEYLLKRLSEVVHPYKLKFRVAGPVPTPLSLNNDTGDAQDGYVVSVDGKYLTRKYTMIIGAEDMGNPAECRRIGEAYGNLVLEQIQNKLKKDKQERNTQ